jgi:hypothetical protein
VLHVRTNLSTVQRAVVLGVAGLALTASPAPAQPDYPPYRYAPKTLAPIPVVASTDLRSPDAKDAADPGGRATSSPAGTTSSSPPVTSSVRSAKAGNSGLDWGSAGIGAGAALAVSLIGLGGVAVTRRAHMHPAR